MSKYHEEYSRRHEVEFLLDNSTRIIQCMMASAWSVIADIKRSM